jgi:hypothetical protein
MATVAAKKVCPIARESFHESAEAFALAGNGVQIMVEPREFSTGSFGFGGQGKVVIKVGGVAVPCQVSLNITAIGSKPEGGVN